MKFDELYKFIGYSLVCLFLFYIAAKSVRFQLRIVEGWIGIKPNSSKSEESENQETMSEEEDATP